MKLLKQKFEPVFENFNLENQIIKKGTVFYGHGRESECHMYPSNEKKNILMSLLFTTFMNSIQRQRT
jgi:hypothetical protein